VKANKSRQMTLLATLEAVRDVSLEANSVASAVASSIVGTTLLDGNAQGKEASLEVMLTY